MGCKEIRKTLSAHPDVTVHPCCGHASFDTDGLCVGNVRTNVLSEMVSVARKKHLNWWIHMHGPMNIPNEAHAD